MKLKKAKLIKSVRDELIKLRYQEVKDSLSGAEGLFIKLIEKSYFLSLGLEISQLYDSRFTASFYLSKTTTWGAIWGDIPRESYKRVGFFLTQEERELYLSEIFNKKGITDAWWDGFEEDEIQKFIEVLKISEKRFLSQDDLFSKIEKSEEVKKLALYASNVIKTVDSIDESKYDYQFIPERSIDNIPINWFMASEKILKEEGAILNKNTVKFLASDAWLQSQIRQVSK